MEGDSNRASQPATPWEVSTVLPKLEDHPDARLTDRFPGKSAGRASPPTSRCLGRSSALSDSNSLLGRVAEWFKAPVLKFGI